MRHTSRRIAAVVALALALLATAQAAQAKTFAWKASGKGGAIYLIGSIHVMSESFYPLNPALEAAFTDSDLLVEEVDLAEMLDPTAQLSILSRGMLPSSQSLDKVISPSTMASGRSSAIPKSFRRWLSPTVSISTTLILLEPMSRPTRFFLPSPRFNITY